MWTHIHIHGQVRESEGEPINVKEKRKNANYSSSEDCEGVEKLLAGEGDGRGMEGWFEPNELMYQIMATRKICKTITL